MAPDCDHDEPFSLVELVRKGNRTTFRTRRAYCTAVVFSILTEGTSTIRAVAQVGDAIKCRNNYQGWVSYFGRRCVIHLIQCNSSRGFLFSCKCQLDLVATLFTITSSLHYIRCPVSCIPMVHDNLTIGVLLKNQWGISPFERVQKVNQ